ncbi:hypothetical protein NM688_g7809 [Phlebia brevispora]|uniref:Uncharacterized protein n=1 Tax=Phlebia brevispora TaxID=194682 RepID=A0ACC1S0X8_9APHY|nr:hypothetical protein NM688_g7809 [Phlebia brevispora]
MKPRLLHGVAVGNRHFQPAFTQYICSCPACAENGVVYDPVQSRFLPGQACPRSVYYEHRKLFGDVPWPEIDPRQTTPLISPSVVLSAYHAALQRNELDEEASLPGGARAQHSGGDLTQQQETEKKPGEETGSKVRSMQDIINLSTLAEIQAEYASRSKAFRESISPGDLVFRFPPTLFSGTPSSVPVQAELHGVNSPSPEQESLGCTNYGPHCLEYGRIGNRLVLERETWLLETLTKVDAILAADRPKVLPLKQAVSSQLSTALKELDDIKEQEWNRRNKLQERARKFCKDGSIAVIDSARYLTRPIALEDPLLCITFVTVIIIHLLSHVSLEHCTFLVHAIRASLSISFSLGSLSKYATNAVLRSIPSDVDVMISELDLTPRCIAYTCCPKCFECYRLSPSGSVPEFCTGKESVDSPVCGRRLWRKNHAGARIPTRRFLYHDMKEWLGRLLCRPGMEKHLDRDVFDTGGSPDKMRDIWDGEVLRNFKGEDHLIFAGQKKGGEGRYIFALNMDGFNPFTNKQAGKKVSVGAVYMVCLNLPPELRYRVENMFLVCLFPGPHHPSLTQINSMIQPIVDDLLIFWHQGVYYAQTFEYSKGRLVRCALVPVICDLPAARQMMAFASFSSRHFCCYCGLPSNEMENLDMPTWPPGIRSREEWVTIAMRWKNATKSERVKIFNQYGVRYTELLRLPYWDPLRYVVIDSMHALFLTLMKHHCRDLWGMDMNTNDGDGMREYRKQTNLPSQDLMKSAWHKMRHGEEKELEKLPIAVLRQLCLEAQLKEGRHKSGLLMQLFQYRKDQGWADHSGNPTDPQSSAVIGAAVADAKLLNAMVVFQRANTVDDLKILHVPPLRQLAKYLLEHCNSPPFDKKQVRTLRKNELIGGLLLWKMQQRSLSLPIPGQEAQSGSGATMTVSSSMASSSRSVITTIQDSAIAIQPRRKVVIGRGILAEIHNDIESIVLPSWIGRIPSNLGSASHGSLSADQWRTACTVNLVTSLGRLWGPCAANSNEHQMLDNFMDLVYATKFGTARTITKEDIQQYHFYMLRYLRNIMELYPSWPLHPYHHMALHFTSFLQAFGPTTSWRCFPFERYNYLLQQIDTNCKFGEMEITMLRRFCVAQNIRALMSNKIIPTALEPDEVIKHTLEKLEQSYSNVFQGKDGRGTLLNDMWAAERDASIKYNNTTVRTRLSGAVYKLLQRRLSYETKKERIILHEPVLKQRTITLRGISFSTMGTSLGDSQVVFRNASNGQPLAGRISEIFLWEEKPKDGSKSLKPFFLVNLLRPLTEADALHDAFRNYSSWIGGSLFYEEFEPQEQLFGIEDVVSHFASTPYTPDSIQRACVHVLPLDRD